MTVFSLSGTEAQQRVIIDALVACDFPFELLLPSLLLEGRRTIEVSWDDLSRYAEGAAAHEHVHDGTVHTLEREVKGRHRVLGLFYLPPHTSIVLDKSLTRSPALAREVFLSEAAHAVDYHFMTDVHRRQVWAALHAGEAVPDGAVIPESGDVAHGHSWFDGPAGYSSWVGEAFMETFVRAFAPSVDVTIHLDHPTTAAAAKEARAALLAGTVFASARGRTFHDRHTGVHPGRWFRSSDDALRAGLTPCRTCKPA